MEREILFRVYDKFNKKMVTVGVDSNASFNYDGSISTHGILGKNPLMQYIGLKDKNGVDIYEGDVCTKMISPDENNLAPKELHRGVIKFHYGGFCYKSGDYYYPMSRTHGDIEVIGNIYQHPELLK